jgi:hypothetical protein
MKKIKFYSNLLILIALFSCNRKLLKPHIYEKNIQLNILTNGISDIVFFPMHHIGKSEFYKDVQDIVLMGI